MVGWVLGEQTDDILNLFALMDEAKTLNQPKMNQNELEKPMNVGDEECVFCGTTSLTDTQDLENMFVTCKTCGYVQTGNVHVPLLKSVRAYGKTVYNPCERFRYWIDLAQGKVKLPQELLKKIEQITSLTELKLFLMQKQNRKYRKFYPCILKFWDEDLVEELSNTDIECLMINFTHLLSCHAKRRCRNKQTGRKKSLPHYIFLITTFLRLIGKEDMASNFLPMKCEKIRKGYEDIIKDLF